MRCFFCFLLEGRIRSELVADDLLISWFFLGDGNVIDEDDDDPPEFDDVEMDFFTDATERYGAKNVVVTPGFVRKKYAFGIRGIPREESDWVEAWTDFPRTFLGFSSYWVEVVFEERVC